MDGLIEAKSIEYLNNFRKNLSYEVFLNKYAPRESYKYLLLPYKKTQALMVLNYFITLVIDNKKKVYGMITSKLLGAYISDELSKLGIKVIFYHGSD